MSVVAVPDNYLDTTVKLDIQQEDLVIKWSLRREIVALLDKATKFVIQDKQVSLAEDITDLIKTLIVLSSYRVSDDLRSNSAVINQLVKTQFITNKQSSKITEVDRSRLIDQNVVTMNFLMNLKALPKGEDGDDLLKAIVHRETAYKVSIDQLRKNPAYGPKQRLGPLSWRFKVFIDPEHFLKVSFIGSLDPFPYPNVIKYSWRIDWYDHENLRYEERKIKVKISKTCPESDPVKFKKVDSVADGTEMIFKVDLTEHNE